MPRPLSLPPWAVLLAAALLYGCASPGPPPPPPPSPAEVVEMAKAGRGASEIIQRMRASRAVYRLPASELAALRAQGVPDPVIDHMQNTYIQAERDDAYRHARDRYDWYGWPGYYWPHPFYHRHAPYYW